MKAVGWLIMVATVLGVPALFYIASSRASTTTLAALAVDTFVCGALVGPRALLWAIGGRT